MAKKMVEERRIPRTMSTQHPDNASIPGWCSQELIQGEDEVYEAYFAYSILGCQEVMWDAEGKDVDTRVMRKLLASHPHYFKKKIIGKDIFLTYRIPNPNVEFAERKIIIETMANIPVGCDIASAFYKREVTPIFEVILPFTTSSRDIIGLYNYYRKGIVDIENVSLGNTLSVGQWLGRIRPDRIEVIPLIEDMDSLLRADTILKPYVDMVRPRYVRVFLARSDPALNYGLISAVILNKLALSKLRSLEENRGLPIYPIIGVGSMPFRGHLSPDSLQGFLEEYRGVYTVTVQSALKFDYPKERVKRLVKALNEKLPCGKQVLIDSEEERLLLEGMKKFKIRYQQTTENLAPLINSVAIHVPERRARMLHIGLYGYSRKVGKAILPRAIPFATVLYSLGIPPEFIGFAASDCLDDDEWEVLRKYYVNMESDLKAVAGYTSWQNINTLMNRYKKVADTARMKRERLKMSLCSLMEDLNAVNERLRIKIGPNNLTEREYENTICNFLIAYIKREEKKAKRHLVEAAKIRRSLG